MCKGRRSDTKPDQQVADERFAKVQTQAHFDEELRETYSDEASTVRREHSGSRSRPKPAGRLRGLGAETGCLQENDNTIENQFQEVGRDVARQLQHSNLQASGSNLDKVARQRCARRPRPEDKQVARGQGARNRGTGRDEHPERMGDQNSCSEATRAARAGFAIDSAKDKVQDENNIQSDQNLLTYSHALEDARITSEPQR